ncbi:MULTISPECIES: ABC transporter ATP-binding protein [Rummeliibacillus]|uniref:ABC transporter ATP-binding protein n=1 Tax=Rummeliibacillus TaxID=648802 RepID=UPI0011B77710|nr:MULTISPECIES: ABC transporter ATP-binding protein [Rummeliibacillus]
MCSLLEVENLNKSFENFQLKEISFSIHKGSIIGFIGINGSGKTTTIKSILGLVAKNSGKIKFLGEDIERHERKIKDQIAFVLDEGYFYEELTLKEMKNIIAPSYQSWDEKLFMSYINRFDLKLNQKIATLSKGMKMKFALSLALSHHAKLLIMDEPTSGLDPLVRSELLDILVEFMKKKGNSVFFSTHITSDLDKIADTIILIDDGKIILDAKKENLLKSFALIKGNRSYINDQTRKLFVRLNVKGNIFEGFTDKKSAVRENMPDVLIEAPTIEDIMLAYIEEGRR